MPGATYAVHTATCTYLLDESGVCKWVHPVRFADPPPGVDRCVEAQFVACLDLGAPGGLVGELQVGAAALFVRHERERFVLLRTLPILAVETLGGIDDAPSFAETPVMPSAHLPTHPHGALEPGEPPMDLEELLSVSVTEVTMTLPLYRPPFPRRPG